jgi:hypothetical protein
LIQTETVDLNSQSKSEYLMLTAPFHFNLGKGYTRWTNQLLTYANDVNLRTER